MDCIVVDFFNFKTHYMNNKNNTNNNNKFTIIQSIDLNNIESNELIYDNLIPIDLNLYIQQIKIFLNEKESIWKQFCNDISRCNITINNVPVKTPNIMLDYFSCEYSEDIAYLVLMISTQVSMGLPYEILHNIYYKRDLYVVEIDDNIRYFNIDITSSNNIINFQIQKNLRVIDISGNSKLYINIKIDFDILNDKYVFISYEKYKENKEK